MDFNKYMLGVESIDNQHMKLLSMVEDVGALVKESRKYDRYDEIASIIQELEKYTVDHFSYEEQLMLDSHYNKKFSHREKHKSFIKQIQEIDINDIDNCQFTFLVSLFDFISTWLTTHINNDDREFAEWYEVNNDSN